MKIEKTDVQSVLKPVVMIGGAAVALGAGFEIWNKVSKKTATTTNWIMPAITVLVGVSAFSYAISGQEIQVIPSVKAGV